MYAAVAGLAAGRWLSAGAALGVAALLVQRHGRARFAAYVFLSVLALRGLAHGQWPTVGFGAGMLLMLQTPPAVRRWPRLSGRRPPRVHGGSTGTRAPAPES
jgi:hypothetical protein